MPSTTTQRVINRAYTYTETTLSGSTTYPVDRAPLLGQTTVTKDGPLAGYKGIIARGDNATTGLSVDEVGVTDVSSSFEYEMVFNADLPPPHSFSRIRIDGPLMSLIPPPSLGGAPGLLPEARNRAIANFYQHLAETQAQFKGMVTAGELGESLRMIRNPAKALRDGVTDYLRHIKRWGDRNRSQSKRKRLSFVRKTWLEYAFGWRPLVSDIDEGVKAFLSSNWTKPIFTMVRSSGKAGEAVPYSSGNTWDVGNGVFIFYDVMACVEAQVKFYGVYHSKGSGPSTFAHYGFSPWEFVPTLWELVPYSFLVDYFTNIGDIVSAWSYRNIGCSWAAEGNKCESRINTANHRTVYLGLQVPPHRFDLISDSPGSSTAYRRTLQRIPSVSIPLPSLELEVPGLSSQKWINITALSAVLTDARTSFRR